MNQGKGAATPAGSAEPVRLHNTMSRRLEPLRPLRAGEVGIYTCGPTVYDAPHIGNLRTFLFEDVLRRSLHLLGYRVTQVMNLTDVEDKIIDGAHRAGQSIAEFTAPHVDEFFADLAALGIEPAEHYPRATEHIDGMIELIEALIEQGYAYTAEGGVFFRIDRFERYGRLSGIDLSQVVRGERVADDEYGKDDVRDFVLWKSAKPGEPSWPSPWGDGRPGWHIECSAMSRHFLGETFDIHCGGVDNIFPHHENEIAQSECAHQAPFVRHWLHSEHLMVDGEKMSKSKGNIYRLADLPQRGASLRALRYLFLSVHYRRKINFTDASLDAAGSALRRLDELRFRLEHVAGGGPDSTADGDAGGEEARQSDDRADATGFQEVLDALRRDFRAALADDLNLSAGLAALFRFVKETNRRLEAGLETRQAAAALAALAEVDRVLGVLDPEAWLEPTQSAAAWLGDAEIEALVERRDAARAERDWTEADRLRDELSAAGVVLEDTPGGTLWRRS